jgi:hypothetical protein
MDKRREDFERFAVENDYDVSCDFDGLYHDNRTDDAWKFWFKALDSRVVELPETCFVSGYDMYSPADIEAMLERAGIKYK